MLRVFRRARDEETGAIFVLFAVMAAALLLVSAFVVDVGNWFEHDRHLQLQVDAGDLAAGQEFTGCFQDPTQTNAAIERTGHKYAGDPDFTTTFPGFGNPFNLQVDDPQRVALRLNSDSYPSGGSDFFMDWKSPTDPVNGPYVPDGVPEAALPCDTKFLDIKATDAGIPTFFGAIPDLSVVDVKARARVEIREAVELSGFLPWAIPEADPEHVAVVFMDEASDSKIAAFELTAGSTAVLNGTLLRLWNGAQSGIDLERETGMIVVTSRLGTSVGDPAFDVSGTLAEICGQAKTACYAGDTPDSGLVFIRANQSATGGGNGAPGQPTPVLGAVSLDPGSCGEDSAPYFLLDAECNVEVRATVDFGAANPDDPPTNARVFAIGPGCGNDTELTLSNGEWTGTCGNPNIDAESGPNTIQIRWTTNPPGPGSYGDTFRNSNGNPVTVARPYAADDNAGPVQYVAVAPNPAATDGPQPVSITVGFPPSLEVADKLDDSILLRFKKGNGSTTQQVNCDAQNLAYPLEPPSNGIPPDSREVAFGCLTTYGTDDDGICPPEYDEASELPPPVEVASPIPTCARVRPGTMSSLRAGLAFRWENTDQPYGSCPPNNWPTTAAEAIPGPEDPRWVILIVTDISAFKAPPGQDPVVPIIKFAGFYITGWDISSQTTGCPGENDPHPLGFGSQADNGDVWGHFVTQVAFVPGATESEKFCNFTEVGVCIAILTQ